MHLIIYYTIIIITPLLSLRAGRFPFWKIPRGQMLAINSGSTLHPVHRLTTVTNMIGAMYLSEERDLPSSSCLLLLFWGVDLFWRITLTFHIVSLSVVMMTMTIMTMMTMMMMMMPMMRRMVMMVGFLIAVSFCFPQHRQNIAQGSDAEDKVWAVMNDYHAAADQRN